MIKTQIDDSIANAIAFSFCFVFSVAAAETSGPVRDTVSDIILSEMSFKAACFRQLMRRRSGPNDQLQGAFLSNTGH